MLFPGFLWVQTYKITNQNVLSFVFFYIFFSKKKKNAEDVVIALDGRNNVQILQEKHALKAGYKTCPFLEKVIHVSSQSAEKQLLKLVESLKTTDFYTVEMTLNVMVDEFCPNVASNLNDGSLFQFQGHLYDLLHGIVDKVKQHSEFHMFIFVVV